MKGTRSGGEDSIQLWVSTGGGHWTRQVRIQKSNAQEALVTTARAPELAGSTRGLHQLACGLLFISHHSVALRPLSPKETRVLAMFCPHWPGKEEKVHSYVIPSNLLQRSHRLTTRSIRGISASAVSVRGVL